MEGSSNDQISKLPEPILHHILSFLYAKDAARMNQTLVNRKKHKISIQKFSLSLSRHAGLCNVGNWFNILIDGNIKELNLRVERQGSFIYDSFAYGSLPVAIFAAKSLNVLSLSGFRIEFPDDDGAINLSSLRELHLSFVFLDEKFFEAMCTSCCNLEHLSLQYFNGLTSFQVGGTLPKLKMINLVNCPHSVLQLVDIGAINLEELTINTHLYGRINVVRITACKALKSLCLNYVDINGNWLEELFVISTIYLGMQNLYIATTTSTRVQV
ncbi:hypothetical protein P3S68_013784 [Capsicum galapagoense]